MGCDIHMYCEKLKTVNGDKKWICVDHFKYNEYFGDDEYESRMTVVPIYDNRNYAVFGVLAGVRDYYRNDQIDEPRGLPDDISDIIQKESDSWDCDGHSHSWLTAKELFEYKEKHPDTIYSGLLSQEQIKDLENGINPTSWCQGCTDPTYERRTWVEHECVIDYLIECVKKRMAEEFWIYDFLDENEKEDRYQKNAENFRIVFWFDN